jgi:cell division septation protein DedD
MEKIINRVMGFLVVAGVVILVCLFLFKNMQPADPAFVKAPPFPQPTQPAVAEAVETVQPVVVSPQTNQAKAEESSHAILLDKSDLIDTTHTVEADKTSRALLEVGKPLAKVKTISEVKKARGVAEKRLVKKKSSVAAIDNHQTDDGLFLFKESVYVIQLGNFQSRTKALNLVNTLRAKGYHAFIQRMSMGYSEHTQVYVGPTDDRASARTLANRLLTDMHLQGTIINYKPLTL